MKYNGELKWKVEVTTYGSIKGFNNLFDILFAFYGKRLKLNVEFFLFLRKTAIIKAHAFRLEHE